MCFVPFLKDMCLTFFAENTLHGNMYLDMLENWLMSQLMDEEEQGFIFQQDRTSPHWHMQMSGDTSIDTYQIDELVMQRPQTTPTYGHSVH